MNVNFTPTNYSFKGNIQKKENYGKRALTAFVVGTVAINAAKVAIGIGRNPAKAARVLKGTYKIKDELYSKALKAADEIFSSNNPKIQEGIEYINKLFNKENMLADDMVPKKFKKIEDYIKEGRLTFDADAKILYKKIKENFETYLEMLRKKPIADYDEGMKIAEDFYNKNHADIDKITEIINGTPECYIGDIYFSERSFRPATKIIECPKEFLNPDNIYYHGTKKAHAIYKEGLTPYISNQTQARELGAAIYTTPSKRVAAGFSGIEGNILPLKLSKNAKVAYLSEDAFSSFALRLHDILIEAYGKKMLDEMPDKEKGKMIECLTSAFYKKAGYDAIYAPKGYKSGGLFNFFTPNINNVLGADQAQLAILSPEKIEIASNDFINRAKDVKDKFATTTNMLKWFSEHPLGF